MHKKNCSRVLSALVMILLLPAPAPADVVECHEQDNLLILANDHVRMTFSPSQGGRCVSLRLAPFGMEKELAAEPGEAAAAGGLLADGFWGPPTSLHNRAYAYTISGDEGSRSIHFVTRVGGDLPYLELHKTITLTADSNRVRVAYQFWNRKESYTDYEFGFILTNHFAGSAGQRTAAVVSMPSGIVRHSAAKAAIEPREFPDPAGDWIALADGPKALVIKADYAHLDSFTYPPCSAIMRKITIECGGSVAMQFSVEPVTDFGDVAISALTKAVTVADKQGVSRREPERSVTGKDISMSVETPHVKWARPYSSGTIKALVLTNVYQQREIVELAQRVGLDVDTVKFARAGGYRYFGEETIKNVDMARKRLLAYLKANDYEVMVIGGLAYQFEFDQAIRDEITRKVTAGMGLVYINPEGLDETAKQIVPLAGEPDWANQPEGDAWVKAKDHFIVNGFDFRIFPVTGYYPYTATSGEVLAKFAETGHPLIATSQHGKGRVVAFGYDVNTHHPDRKNYYAAGMLPQLANWQSTVYYHPHYQSVRELDYHFWEYQFAMIGKSVIWAAQAENDFDLPEFAWANDGKAIEFTVANSGKTTEALCSLVFRNKHSEVIGRDRMHVQVVNGTTVFAAPIDVQPMHGRNYCELIISNKQGQSLTWGTALYQSNQPAYIDRIELSRKFYPAGEPVTGRIHVKGSPAIDTNLTLELYDVDDRLVDIATMPCKRGTADEISLPMSLATDRCVGEGGRLVARLVAGGRAVDMMREQLIISTPFDEDKFYLSGWWSRFGGYYLKEERMKRLRNVIGYTLIAMRPLEGDQDITHWRKRGWKVLRNYVFWPKDDKSLAGESPGPFRNPCWSDPAIIKRYTGALVGSVVQGNTYGGMLDHGIGDELTLGDKVCFCPHCLKNFRDLLRAEYANVGDLNAEWETKHASFDEIVPDKLDQAHARGNYASWVLWRQSMEASLVNFLRHATTAMQEHDPYARIHLSGTIGDLINYGMDYWNTAKIINFKGYNEWWLVGELLRSFQTTRNYPYAYSWGHIWLNVFQGAYDGCGSWCMSQLPLSPDLTIRTSGIGKKAFMDRVARPGLTRLMKNSIRDNTRVALHYSRLSRFAGKAMEPQKGEHPIWEYNVESWSVALNTLGLQSDMVSYHELEGGKLTPDNYDVFIIPTSYALRPGEVKAVIQYVRDGGSVIADGRIGEFSHHLIVNKRRPLDELFGIESSPTATPGEAAIGPMKARVEVFDTGLKTLGAERMFAGRLPVALFKRHGKGKAFYLNFRINPYHEPKSPYPSILSYCVSYLKLEDAAQRAESNRLTAQHALIAEILRRAGKTPAITARNVDGSFLLSKLVRYESGQVQMLGFLACSRPDKAVEIQLDRKYHVYDILAERDLGLTDKIRAELKGKQDLPGGVYFVTHARLYALLPEELDGFALKAPTVARAGDEVKFSMSIPGKLKGTTTVYITVQGPSGRHLRHYSQSMLMAYGNKSGAGTIKLALNDAPGQWKITARDMLSGATTDHTFSVRP